MTATWRSAFLAAVLAVATWAAPASGTVEVGPESAPAVALAHRVELLKKALDSGSNASVEAAATQVELLRRNFGTLDLTPLVESLVVWARERGASGEPERGLKALQVIEQHWAPRNPTVLGAKVVLARQMGIAGYVTSLPDLMDLTKLRLSNPAHRWLWIVQHAAWLRMMATLMLWGWALALALRYRRVLRYIWEEPLGRRGIGGFPSALIGAFLLSLPVLVGLDPSVAALLWICLLAPYLYVPEVKATYVVIALQLIHPILMILEPGAIKPPEPSLVSYQLQPRPRPLAEAVRKALPAPDQAFLDGWQSLQASDWAAAEAAFAGLQGKHLDQAEVLNNLGTARFHLGRAAEAEKHFEEAFRLKPDSPQILLNQSVMAFQRLDTPLGIAKQEEARKVAPDTYEILKNASQSKTEPWVFALPLPDSPERVEVLRAARPTPSYDSYGSRAPSILFGLLLPILGLGGFMFRLARSLKQAHPTQCQRCGDPFHTTDSPDVEVCSKCHHLFVLKDGLHGESRKLKVEEVTEFQHGKRWIHRILAIVLPGADLCFLGETVRGFVELSFLCCAMGVVFVTGRVVRYPGEILPDPSSIWLPLGVGLLAVLFLRSWLKLLPRSIRL